MSKILFSWVFIVATSLITLFLELLLIFPNPLLKGMLVGVGFMLYILAALIHKKVMPYLGLVTASLLLSNIVIFVFFNYLSDILFGQTSDYNSFYSLLLILGSPLRVFPVAIAGWIFARLYNLCAEKLPIIKKFRHALAILFVGIMCASVIISLNRVENENNERVVDLNRTEFIKRIIGAIRDGRLIKYSNEELIREGIPTGIYKTEGNFIINDYGGAVWIAKNEEDVRVGFDGIPTGDSCTRFHTMDNHEWRVFERIKINDITIFHSDYSSQKERMLFNDQCRALKKTVDVEFIGRIVDIKVREVMTDSL